MLFDHKNDLLLPYLTGENIRYKCAYHEVPWCCVPGELPTLYRSIWHVRICGITDAIAGSWSKQCNYGGISLMQTKNFCSPSPPPTPTDGIYYDIFWRDYNLANFFSPFDIPNVVEIGPIWKSDYPNSNTGFLMN